MIAFLLFTTFTATVLAELELQPSSTAGRVVGGTHVQYHNSWPWQVYIQDYYDGSYHLLCGGTLIKRRWVMTAAQCVYSYSRLRVVLGDVVWNNHFGSEQTRDVGAIFVHPEWNYNSISSGNDIALLQLSSDVSLTSYVNLANLPKSGEILPNNLSCYITGFGYTSTGGSLPNHLMQAVLRIVDHQTCTSFGWWGSTVKTTMICAGGSTASGCNGDFGGPLNCQVNGSWYVHGIASFVSAMGCNTPQKPTVFTRVSAYITWINSVINSS
ncbi:elastase-1-like [Parambassis ranga]|uniref:pancreatic elastase n=1 Tax=Parambassis ranga TaxID=210632 RepID=A0A6P7HZJ2_9TELE|nr:elastase-1-like [Parambassis ranga]